MEEDICLMDFLFLILFVSAIHPWLIFVNDLVAAFDALERNDLAYVLVYDSLKFRAKNVGQRGQA